MRTCTYRHCPGPVSKIINTNLLVGARCPSTLAKRPRTSGTFPTKTNAPITRQHSPYKPGPAPQRNLGPTKPRTSSTFATNPTTPETTTALIKMEAHAPMPRHHCQPQVREEAVAPSVVDYGPHKKLFPAQIIAHTPP